MRIFYRVFQKIERILNQIYNRRVFKKYRVVQGRNITINGKIIISCEVMNNNKLNLPSISIGSDVKINSGLKYNLIGGENHTILRTVDDGQIIIGDRVAMSNVTIVSHKKIVVEEDVMIGGDVRIYDSDFHSLQFKQRIIYPDLNIISKPIVIKQGAFIGAGSIILKGVTIGENSIVGAGSVVAKNIPQNEIWVGNPAKFIRKIGD